MVAEWLTRSNSSAFVPYYSGKQACLQKPRRAELKLQTAVFTQDGVPVFHKLVTTMHAAPRRGPIHLFRLYQDFSPQQGS